MTPVDSSNLYGIVSKKIETAEIFLVSVCKRNRANKTLDQSTICKHCLCTSYRRPFFNNYCLQIQKPILTFIKKFKYINMTVHGTACELQSKVVRCRFTSRAMSLMFH